MFGSILVANRGEIARRIFRTARQMGLRTIAVFSEADQDAPFVQEADEAVLIGSAAASDSYLDGQKVLEAARLSGAESIHPGYGFLSENAEFAEKVKAAGLVWIGPDPSSIRAMGLKDAAKARMQAAKVPVTPGYLGEDQSPALLQAEADKIGYPVLIKAVAGGGGKGMKRVDRTEDFAEALASAQREAKAAFGDAKVLLEKYLTCPRHIEVQVFGDTHGQVVHLFERDCSLQRRHQKVIEEAPAPGMDDQTRQAVCAAAVRAAKAVNYVGAGTIEFIADASEGLRADRIYFMEMNTRLQVEHPVTEMITGQDLVEWQIKVAAGQGLPLTQDEIVMDGHAIEARLYAEDPNKGFLPSTGPLAHFILPDNDEIRVDSGVEEGGQITPFYDPMIAKLICHQPDRETAALTLAAACQSVEIYPVKTNAAFLARCLTHDDFLDGAIDTGFIGANLDQLVPETVGETGLIAALALAAEDTAQDLGQAPANDPHSPWAATGDGAYGVRLNAPRRALHQIEIDGQTYEGEVLPHLAQTSAWSVRVGDHDPALLGLGEIDFDRVTVNGAVDLAYARLSDGGLVLFDQGQALTVREVAQSGHTVSGPGASDGALRSPMPGRIVAVFTQDGAQVQKGAPILVLEAMKMEHQLTAPHDGLVEGLKVAVGDQVTEGVVLAKITAQAPSA